MNPLFNIFNSSPQQNAPFPMNLMMEFQKFRQNFQGDPRQQVQNMLNSGQMTQEQFNQLSQLAQSYKHFFNR